MIPPNITSKEEVEQSKENFKVGDVVLFREDSVRNKGPMARIFETEPEPDSTGTLMHH